MKNQRRIRISEVYIGKIKIIFLPSILFWSELKRKEEKFPKYLLRQAKDKILDERIAENELKTSRNKNILQLWEEIHRIVDEIP